MAGRTRFSRDEPREEAEAPLLIRALEAADILSLSPRKLWELTNRSAIPHRRVGRCVRYVPRELQEWIDAGCPEEPMKWQLRARKR